VTASHFRELEVWQLAMQLAKTVYQLAADFPRDERFGLTAQLQRSAVSVPSNIAEGNARKTTKDYARFVSIAAGSAAELQTQLLLARELKLGSSTILEESLNQCDRVGQMLHKLFQALERKHSPESRVPGPGSREKVPSSESR
jgi:carbamoyl-phosphate synthase large subunit